MWVVQTVGMEGHFDLQSRQNEQIPPNNPSTLKGQERVFRLRRLEVFVQSWYSRNSCFICPLAYVWFDF